jgi:hypothetical protein
LFLPNLKNNLIATLTQLSSRENPVFATRWNWKAGWPDEFVKKSPKL